MHPYQLEIQKRFNGKLIFKHRRNGKKIMNSKRLANHDDLLYIAMKLHDVINEIIEGDKKSIGNLKTLNRFLKEWINKNNE